MNDLELEIQDLKKELESLKKVNKTLRNRLNKKNAQIKAMHNTPVKQDEEQELETAIKTKPVIHNLMPDEPKCPDCGNLLELRNMGPCNMWLCASKYCKYRRKA